MFANNGTAVIEPVEEFLAKIICVDRLALYQTAIDLIKQQEKYSYLDALNSILDNVDDESPAEVEALIRVTIVEQLREMLTEYDIITSGSDVGFLSTLLTNVSALDEYEASEALVNIIETSAYSPAYTLYTLLELISPIDEEQYSQTVQIVSMSLLDRIRQIHLDKLTKLDDLVAVEAIDLSILRRVAKAHNDRILNRILADAKISNPIPDVIATQLAKPYFEDYSITDPKEVARDLIGVYLLTGLTGVELLEVIKTQITSLISDDDLISKVSIVLGNVYGVMINE